jgi:putative MATE family efflux protein
LGEDSVANPYIHDPGRSGFIELALIRRIVVLGLPVIIGMLTQTLINQVDAMFIGRLPEAEAVPGHAAMGPSLILLWAFGGFLSAISVGTQALAARRVGESDVLGAGRVLTNSLVLAISTSVLATGVAIALVPHLFPLMHSDKVVQRIGIEFCQIRFLGILPMVVTASVKSFYDGLGRTRIHMTVAIVMNIINFVLCWIFVFGNLGVEAMGVNGAGWAAVLSSSAGMLMLVAYSLNKDDRRTYRFLNLKNLDAAVARRISTLSVFSGFATVFVMTGFALFLRIPAHLDEVQKAPGTNAAAAWDVITIMMVVFMTCIAFGTSTATLVAQSLGARKPDLASRYGWQSVLLIIVVMGGIGALVFSFPEELMRLFLPKEEGKVELLKDAAVAIAVPSLRFTGFLAPIAAAALVLTQALYGAGESRFVAIIEAVLHFGCLVPLAYVLSVPPQDLDLTAYIGFGGVLHLPGMGIGLLGCWYATAIYGLLLLAATAWRFAAGRWKSVVM